MATPIETAERGRQRKEIGMVIPVETKELDAAHADIDRARDVRF